MKWLGTKELARRLLVLLCFVAFGAFFPEPTAGEDGLSQGRRMGERK